MLSNSGEFYSLEALLVLYDLEPGLRDVYVEGRTDVGLLRWYLDERGIEAQVYAIDDRVEISATELGSLGLDIGARGRVIGLSIVAERALGKDQQGITCVADADYARLTGPMPRERSCLLFTDSASLECYVLQPRPLNKLLRMALHLPTSVIAEDVLEALVPALLDLQCARAVLFAFDISCIDGVVKLCTLRVGASAADIRKVVQKSMGRVAKAEHPLAVDDVVAWAHELRSTMQLGNQFGRGHDIALMLSSFLGLKGAVANPEALEAAMRASLEVVDLQEKPLFLGLESRLAS